MFDRCDGLFDLFLQTGGVQTNYFDGSIGYLSESIAVFYSKHIEKACGTV